MVILTVRASSCRISVKMIAKIIADASSRGSLVELTAQMRESVNYFLRSNWPYGASSAGPCIMLYGWRAISSLADVVQKNSSLNASPSKFSVRIASPSSNYRRYCEERKNWKKLTLIRASTGGRNHKGEYSMFQICKLSRYEGVTNTVRELQNLSCGLRRPSLHRILPASCVGRSGCIANRSPAFEIIFKRKNFSFII